MLLRRRPAVPSPPAPALRRAFRSAAALEAIRSHSLPSATTTSSPPGTDDDDQAAEGPTSLALYNYPTFAGAYAALAARLFHRRARRRLLVLPFSSVEPFSVEDFEAAGFQTCYLLDFIGPKNFAFELARFVPSVIAFDHRQSTLARIPQLGPCPSNVELHVDTTKTSAGAVFDYFSKKHSGTKSDAGMFDNLLEQEDQKRVSNVLKYIEDADLRRWELPNTKEFQAALRDERAKLNCIINPHVFEQLLQLDVSDLLMRGKSLAHDRLQAATEFINKPFKIKLGRGAYGACLKPRNYIALAKAKKQSRAVAIIALALANTAWTEAIRADGHSELSHEIGLELSKRSAAAGLRPIGAVVFMQRGILKICLRTTDNKTNTLEIAKAHGGGGKPSSSSFALTMEEFNSWISVST